MYVIVALGAAAILYAIAILLIIHFSAPSIDNVSGPQIFYIGIKIMASNIPDPKGPNTIQTTLPTGDQHNDQGSFKIDLPNPSKYGGKLRNT